MEDKPKYNVVGGSLKEGPVIYQQEDYLMDKHKAKKNLALAELNHVFKMYLQECDLNREDISIHGQFSIIFNHPKMATWHKLSKAQQSDELSEIVLMPEVYDELITSIGDMAGDAQAIKSVVKDAYQNAIDSFSHAAFLQRKYLTRFPGIKIILFADQVHDVIILAVIDNGYGKKIVKPKKNHTGHEYGDDMITRFVDWVVRRFFEQDEEDEEDEIRWDIAYTGGQGMALKKLEVEFQFNVEVHFLASGAVFEMKLKNYF